MKHGFLQGCRTPAGEDPPGLCSPGWPRKVRLVGAHPATGDDWKDHGYPHTSIQMTPTGREPVMAFKLAGTTSVDSEHTSDYNEDTDLFIIWIGTSQR